MYDQASRRYLEEDVASVKGDAAAQMAAAAAGTEDEGLAEVGQQVEMEAGSGWKRGARRARAMADDAGQLAAEG